MRYRCLLLAPLLLSTFSLAGCGKTSKIALTYGQMASNDVTYIDYQTLSEKISSKETFMVSIYAQTCSCWSVFHSVVNEYTRNNHIQMFAVNYNNFHDTTGKTLDSFGLNIESGYVTLGIFEKGDLKINLKSGSDKLFKTISSFEQFMSSTVTLPKKFYISGSELDELYRTNETSLIYFARSTCSDCTYFDRNVLDDYKATNNIYIIDTESLGIREYQEDGSLTPESQIAWNNFKNKYGLSNVNNPNYGYDVGYTPSLFLIKGNESGNPEYLSGSVYFNDTLEKDGDNYKISMSYYSEARKEKLSYLANMEGTTILEGLTVPASEVITYGDYAMWNQDDAAKYHNKFAKAFLDENVSKVTHLGFVIE